LLFFWGSLNNEKFVELCIVHIALLWCDRKMTSGMWCGGVQFVVMSDTSVRVAVRFVHCTLHMYLISLSSAHFKAGMPYSITHSVGIVFVGYTLTQLVWYDIYDYFPSQTAYLHHVRIVHNAEHCNSQSASVRPSVRPSICPSRSGIVCRRMKIWSCGFQHLAGQSS